MPANQAKSNHLRLQINGERRDVDANLSLLELVQVLELKPEQIAVELNHVVVRRAEWASTVLKEDDRVEIVHFVGGGKQEAGAGGRSRRQGAGGRGQGAGGRRQAREAGAGGRSRKQEQESVRHEAESS